MGLYRYGKMFGNLLIVTQVDYHVTVKFHISGSPTHPLLVGSFADILQVCTESDIWSVIIVKEKIENIFSLL